ncbi:MAG: fructose-specific PTS transporter subunit EIIC [Mycoplasma sp.]|nr:fructose-specific PTS transporter subunit EIIC [Mycoplasma sp.]
MIEKLLSKKAIILNLKSNDKTEIFNEISEHLEKNSFIESASKFKEALLKRELDFSTGIGNEIAIPHAQSDTVLENVILIARYKDGVEWNSLDNKPVKYIFTIALNNKEKEKQVEVLKTLAKTFMNPEINKNLAKAKTKDQLLNTLINVEEKNEISKPAIVKSANSKKVVAVTACPTGIAHTYMAAEKLEEGAKKLGYQIKVETQGRTTDNALTQNEIDEADIIVLAIDKGIDNMGRFNGKEVIQVGTSAAIKNPVKLITEGKTKIIKASSATTSNGSNSATASGEYSWSEFKNVYRALMGGVSRMLPFIIAGGILLGIGFLIDTGNSGGTLGVTRGLARWFSGLGKIGLTMFVPVLGGYVAYSIVGSEGLMPGFFAGFIASASSINGLLYDGSSTSGWANLWGWATPGIDQGVLSAGSGFIGAMVGGYLAAASVVIMRKYVFFKVNKTFRGIVDIVAMPITTALLTGIAMFAFQIPLAYFAYGLKLGLTDMEDAGLIILLTTIIGLMMAFDMGGPVNKVAYVLAVGLISGSNPDNTDYEIMGATMIAGMTPPLGIAFSNLIFGKKAWSQVEIESSRANWLLGLFFITEGAIPFAAKDPKRTIPSLMIGSAVAGLLSGLLHVGVSAPHGGIIVISLFKSYLFNSNGAEIGMGILFMLTSLIAGMATTGTVLGLWRMRDIKKGKLELETVKA